MKVQTVRDALFKLDQVSGNPIVNIETKEAAAVGYRAIALLKSYMDLDVNLSHDEFISQAEQLLIERLNNIV